MGKWITLAILLVFLALAAVFAYVGWNLHGDVEMSAHGYIAMALGIGFTLVVGVGLMALVFYSSRKGYDERAGQYSIDEPDQDVRPR
jgi:hypothetical protein